MCKDYDNGHVASGCASLSEQARTQDGRAVVFTIEQDQDVPVCLPGLGSGQQYMPIAFFGVVQE